MNTLDQIVRTLGQPQALQEIGCGTRLQAAVARWRYGGAFIDLSGADAYQVVFNISGGQVVEIHAHGDTIRHSIRAGSTAIVYPNDAEGITVTGQADTLQFLITREFIESVTDRVKPSMPLPLVRCEPQLKAAAAQALVALGRHERQNDIDLDSLVTTIACRFVQSAVRPSPFSRGGLSPGARRLVHEFVDRQLANLPQSRLALGELAAAAGLSVHHFVKAFQQSEGETPYACVITRRIDKALTLLLQKKAQVGQIADETGFSSPSHFVSAFRKHVGVTPGAFRDAANP